MKKLILIVSIVNSGLIFSQTKKCSIQELQLDTYDFVLNHLNRIKRKFEDNNSLIEVSIDFKEYRPEQEEKKDYPKIINIDYYLVSPENSYSGEYKEKVKVYTKLEKFIVEEITNCIEESNYFKAQLYSNLTFRIPLNKTNIAIAIEQVKSTIDK